MVGKSIFTFRVLLSAVCILPVASAYAQTDINRQVILPKIMPVSPEAASLGKFGQIPVSYYRGVPNISIPMFQVKEGMIELPVQLSYHAGGIKVEEMAANVGLAWALNAGGVITRTQKGLDDEIGYFGNYSRVRRFVLGGMTSTEQDEFKVDVYRGNEDSQPDMFYYNFAGISGKFFCSDSGKLYSSPRTDLKITYASSVFTIVDGNGIVYRFADVESTTSEPFTNGSNNDLDVANTAWYLTSITDPMGNVVNFTYTASGSSFRTKSNSTFNLSLTGVSMGCSDYFSDSYNQVSVSRPAISEISFSTGKIRFTYESTTRLDATDNAMRQITLLNQSNDTIKYFRLYTGYFTTNNIGGCDDTYGYRLRLDSLQEFGKNGKKSNPYKFVYNSNTMPCRLSNAQDHWGYYNGQNNLQFVRYQNAENGPWIGANKEIDSTAAKTGLLEIMTYPTGGRTEFTYEGNVYSYSVPEGFDPTHPVAIQSLYGTNNNSGGNYLVTFTSTFSIASGDLSPSGYVWATADLTTFCADPSVINIFTIRITGSNGYDKTVVHGDSLHLAAGNYTITGTIETEFAGVPFCEFTFGLNKIPYNPLTYYNKAYGGVRIGRIRDYDAGNHVADVRTFKYTAFDMPGVPGFASSGDFSGLPDNMHYSYTKLNCPPAPGSCCNYRIYNSVSNYPLLFTGSSPIGYKNVTMYTGPDGIGGKQEFTYTSYSDYPDQVSYTMPFFFASEFDWRKGLLVKQTDYKYAGSGTYVPVQKKIMDYAFHTADTTKKMSRGIVLGKTVELSGTDDNSILYNMQVASYDVIAEAFNVAADTTYMYDQDGSGNAQMLTNGYIYSPKNFKLARKLSRNSRNDLIAQNFRYALDFSASGANANRGKAIWNLQTKNIISAPIESVATQITGGTEYVLFGSLNSYRTDLPLIDTVYSLEERGSTPLSSFAYATVNGNNQLTFFSSYRPRIVQSRYTSKGKYAEMSKYMDQKVVTLWDYSGELAVAMVTGADSADVAYSSFESIGKGNWVYSGAASAGPDAPTGRRYYNLAGGNIVKAGLSSGTSYKVTYWKKDASGTTTVNSIAGSAIVTKNGWTLFDHILSGTTSITLAGTGSIDELRLYPSLAEMATNTYDPLIGVTAQCNNNNQIQYFEYDALSRLYLTRDHDRNIVKRFCYNLYGQPEECAYNISPIWQSTGVTRCQPCPANGAYLTNIQEHQEKNINPNSSSVDSIRWVSDGVSVNCTATIDWQNTATPLRCRNIDGVYTGEREQEQQNMNPCTGGATRWVVVDQNCSVCPKPQTWEITGNIRCAVDGSSNNTGYQEREERNTESCSAGYNTTRWVGIGQNCSTCPKPQNWQATGNYRCVKDGSNNNTGYQEREEQNVESCSPDYNATRWVNVGVNCTSCEKPANWQPTGNYRCAKDGSNNNTGNQEQEERNQETCSSTYNITRWVSIGQNCTTCPKPQNWQATGNYRCVKDGSNNNTGYQEREERNTETCSENYNSTRWVSNGYNTTSCPLPSLCNSGNCSGANKKCVNDICETGVRVCTDSYYDTGIGMFVNTYHYEFSDGSWSPNYQEYDFCDCPQTNCV